MEKSPILNNPYEEPTLHYATDDKGALNYEDVRDGRRLFTPDMQSIPERQKEQKGLFDVNDFETEYGLHLINLIRKEVAAWRQKGYPETTRVSKELLSFWFLNPERSEVKRLFFAQREAIETAIYLNEIAPKSNAGQNILNKVRYAQQLVSEDPGEQLPRLAFKMATGTGKTVVMASLILYHFFNRQEYRNDVRFADNFLIVAPGITIRDRLSVLLVDRKTGNKNERSDYYAQRDLVPPALEKHLGQLNAKIIITNYHAFMPRTLQGNKKSPFDGKIKGYDEEGKAIREEALEDYSQVLKRVVGNFKWNTRLLVLNDEAHHCYKPKSSGKTKDSEESDENAKAAVWFTGLVEIAKRYKLQSVYDLSATPYYLSGSGYLPYSLFGWVVTDFGLVEAMESGLVKIPFLPEGDNTQDLDGPKLKNLYDHVKDQLPKKGQRKKKAEARKEGAVLSEEPPQLPHLVKGALDQFYGHYKAYEKNIRGAAEEKANLFTKPPVFIAVCNNTSVSKEVYKFIAGYEYQDQEGSTRVVPGHFDLFSNYDEYGRLKHKSPTLLIDSEALEESGQVNDDFKKVFSSEIEEFKKEYARLHGQGSAEKITDAEILREVVNTVGQPGKLGGHIRCVVSVSMLTEGWDANTVTHIMGLRAFGSQLLCEQVAGRALRRMNYLLQGYDKEGFPTTDKRRVANYKFPPEYAHIIGVPFNMFKGGSTGPTPPPPTYTYIRAVPERQRAFEITFPNVIGYRVDYKGEELSWDFSNIGNYEFDGSRFPTETEMGNAFSDDREVMKVEAVLEKRDQEIIYMITKDLIRFKFSDDSGAPKHHLFFKLKEIVTEWYETKVLLLNIRGEEYKRLLYYDDPKTITDHIATAINQHLNTAEFIRPVLNHYNPFNSTKYVSGHTTKDTFNTTKSHVNKVVMDSDWEAIAAKTLEEMEEVNSYVKNQFLGFSIPYVKEGTDRQYFPDFIADVVTPQGKKVNLVVEVTGMNKDKTEKKWYMENRWLPGINAVREQYEMNEWAFIEVANDIRNIRNELIDKIRSLDTSRTDDKLSRLKHSFGTIKSDVVITSEDLRRENFYGEDGR